MKKKKNQEKPTTKQLEQQCKEFSEALGFENPIKKLSHACEVCDSENTSVIGFCYDCGSITDSKS